MVLAASNVDHGRYRELSISAVRSVRSGSKHPLPSFHYSSPYAYMKMKSSTVRSVILRGEGDLNPRVLFGQWISASESPDSNPSPCLAGPSPLRALKRNDSY